MPEGRGGGGEREEGVGAKDNWMEPVLGILETCDIVKEEMGFDINQWCVCRYEKESNGCETTDSDAISSEFLLQ